MTATQSRMRAVEIRWENTTEARKGWFVRHDTTDAGNEVWAAQLGQHTRIAVCDMGEDADFIAHAYEDIPWLIARVQRLEEALREAKVEHKDIIEGTDTRGCRAGQHDPFYGGKYGCSDECGADAHNLLIDIALREDP